MIGLEISSHILLTGWCQLSNSLPGSCWIIFQMEGCEEMPNKGDENMCYVMTMLFMWGVRCDVQCSSLVLRGVGRRYCPIVTPEPWQASGRWHSNSGIHCLSSPLPPVEWGEKTVGEQSDVQTDLICNCNQCVHCVSQSDRAYNEVYFCWKILPLLPSPPPQVLVLASLMHNGSE